MGNLLKILWKDDGSKESNDLFVNFENAEPTDAELSVYNQVKIVLEKCQAIIIDMQQYTGATEAIRQAISTPKSNEFQQKAWEAVCPLVVKLRNYYEFSTELDRITQELLGMLTSIELTPREHLEQQQALFRQFADILDFVLRFDDLKMTNPSIQNDFAYYRRTLNKMKANEERIERNIVTVEMANKIALFYANSTPMLKVLSDSTTKFVSTHKDLPVENTTDCLSTMANICKVMIESPVLASRFQSVDTKLFCLRVMVGVIILYDHVHPAGAFVKTSTIDMKGSIKVLKDQEVRLVEGLLNALRYTTLHINDDSTPKIIKAMLSTN